MSEKIWNNFAKGIKNMIPNIDLTVLNKLKSQFLEMPSDFFTSKPCSDLLENTLKNITDNKLKVYIHLLEFKKTLRSTKKLKRKGSKVIVEVENKRTKVSESVPETPITEVKVELDNFINPSVTESLQNNSDLRLNITESNISLTSIHECLNKPNDQSKIEKYIAKLENVLQATKDQIEKLEEQEMTIEDLDSEMSPFVMLDKLKSHYVKVWKKISKLRETRSNLHKRYLKSFSFSGSVYPELNKEIENFVKMKKFPDYNDIKTLVLNYFKSKSNCLSVQKINELSVDIFTQIGNKLKKLRISEFRQYFGSHLTDQVKPENDPMIYDEKLRKVLHQNYVQGELKLDAVLETYAKMQQTNGESINNESINNESDISTEHSIDSDQETHEKFDNDDEDLDDEEPLLDSLTCNTLQEKENETSVEIHDQEIVEEKNEVPVDSSIQIIPQETTFENIEITQNNHLMEVVLMTKSTNEVEKPSEEYLNEISSTTFRFNVEQMKHGDKSKYYQEIITINSDDDGDSNESNTSSDDENDATNSRYTYSSKLDDFVVTNPKLKKPEIKEILINLDDDDDEGDEDDIIFVEESSLVNTKENNMSKSIESVSKNIVNIATTE